jgi:hypothetical protein
MQPNTSIEGLTLKAVIRIPAGPGGVARERYRFQAEDTAGFPLTAGFARTVCRAGLLATKRPLA